MKGFFLKRKSSFNQIRNFSLLILFIFLDGFPNCFLLVCRTVPFLKTRQFKVQWVKVRQNMRHFKIKSNCCSFIFGIVTYINSTVVVFMENIVCNMILFSLDVSIQYSCQDVCLCVWWLPRQVSVILFNANFSSQD